MPSDGRFLPLWLVRLEAIGRRYLARQDRDLLRRVSWWMVTGKGTGIPKAACHDCLRAV
jgi:hypothetical protein